MTSIIGRRALWGAGLSILLSVAGGGAVMLGLPQHFEADAATETAAAPPPAVPVSVARAQSKRITTWEEFSGRLEAIERVGAFGRRQRRGTRVGDQGLDEPFIETNATQKLCVRFRSVEAPIERRNDRRNDFVLRSAQR